MKEIPIIYQSANSLKCEIKGKIIVELMCENRKDHCLTLSEEKACLAFLCGQNQVTSKPTLIYIQGSAS